MDCYAIIGLGYVGLNLALAFANHSPTFGYDINQRRITKLRQNIDENGLFTSENLNQSQIVFTDSLDEISSANFYLITVATPLNFAGTPDLDQLMNASEMLAKILKLGDIVVFESSVYPGTTEELCIPILEKFSKLKNGKDFFVGYSPERINPQDEEHVLANITKIIAAQDSNTLQRMRFAYESICKKVISVSSIAAAEACKLLENAQRDVNIAFMNEFTQAMHALNLDSTEIIAAAKTKWNFLPCSPGLVGGHCIPVDPLYLTYKAKEYGVSMDLIFAARKINDNVTNFIIQELLKILVLKRISTQNLTIGIFGITYKPNTRDYRNSLSLKLLTELEQYDFQYKIHDPLYESVIYNHKQIKLHHIDDIGQLSVAIILVGHDCYNKLGLAGFVNKFGNCTVIMDIPGIFYPQQKSVPNLTYWHL